MLKDASAFFDAWLGAWSNGDVEALLKFYHPEARYLAPDCPHGIRGHNQLKVYFENQLKAYPDWHWTRQELFKAETGWTLRWRLDWAEPWRPVIQGLSWIELQDNLIQRQDAYFDTHNWPKPAWSWQIEKNGERFEISSDKQRLDRPRLLAMLRDTYWAENLTPEQLEQRIKTSFCFGLYRVQPGRYSRELIGFARALTDTHTIAYLADVILAPEWRGQGLGTWLTSTALDHPDLQPMRRWLLRTRDAHSLYHKLGFEPLRDLNGWLERWVEGRV